MLTRLIVVTLAAVLAFYPESFAPVSAKTGTVKETSGRKKTTGTKKSSGKRSSTSASGKKRSGKKKSKNKNSVSDVPETAAEAQARAEAAQREIRQTKEKIKLNERSIRQGLDELGKLDGSIGLLKKEVGRMSAEVTALTSEINALEVSIAESEAELAGLRESYLKALKKMRVGRKNNSDLAFLFSSGSLSQAMRRMRYLRQVADWRDRQSKKITDKLDKLRRQTALLGETRKAKDATLRRQQAAQARLMSEYKRQDAIVVELRANGEALQNHLVRKQTEANDLRNRVARLIAAEEARAAAIRAEEKRKAEAERMAEQRRRQEESERADKLADNVSDGQTVQKQKENKENAASVKKSDKKHNKKTDKSKDKGNKDYAAARKRRSRGDAAEGSASAAPNKQQSDKSKTGTVTSASGFESMKGRLPRPVDGVFRVTGQFGRHSLPELPDVVYDNPGIDVEVSRGAAAKAVFDGKVSGVYVVPGFNTVVIISHGNYYTVYGNISTAAVKVGDSVKTGHKIGIVANDVDDNSHGSFHFEVWKNRDKQNPLNWIR